jgi:hypothetical protein
MGLGPPVCEHCGVLTYYDVDVESWHCKYCSNKKPQWHMFACGLTGEQLEGNARFLDFVKGFDNASASRGPNST